MRTLLLLLLVACKGTQTAEESKPPPPAAPHPTVTKPLIPPDAVGESRSAIEGCLAAEKNDAAGASFPVARSATAPVRISVTGTGAIVTHELAHACCLEGKVETEVEGAKVTVREALSGQACRCMCSSKLQTAVRLEPGEYEVAVLLSQSGTESQVHQEKITIP